MDDLAADNADKALNARAEALTYHEELIATSRDLKERSEKLCRLSRDLRASRRK
jgi:hypothetical protein